MNRNFYQLGIFYLALSTACGLFQSIIHFKIGSHLYLRPPFAEWYLVVSIISLIGSLFLIKYYYYKKYWFTFLTSTIAAIASLCWLIVFYIYLVSRASESYYLPSLVFFWGTTIVYSLSLIFSNAGQRIWLKIAGIFTAALGFVAVAALIWSMLFPQIYSDGPVEKLSQWASLAGSILPVLFIINFWKEVRALKAVNGTTPVSNSFTWADSLKLIGSIAVLSALIFGKMLASESFWYLDGVKRGAEIAQKLAQQFESRSYVNSKGDTLHYLLMKPLDYETQKKYPLVVCLHGGTWGLPPDAVRHIEVPEPSVILSNPENRKKYPAFLFMPQCPPGASWGGVPGFPAADSLIFETIAALEEEFSIDEKRRYVAGGSGGGMGSWHFIGTRPEMFAAAIPFCGAGNPALAPKMVDVPVWAFHGSVDRNVPVRSVREMIEAIRKAGGKPRYTEFPGVGHNVWPEISKTPGLLEWLFTQKRD